MAIPLICQRVQDEASDYLDHVLPSRQFENVDKHLGGCEACRMFVKSLRMTVQELNRMQVEAPDQPPRRHALRTFRRVLCKRVVEGKAALSVASPEDLWAELSHHSQPERARRVTQEARYKSESLCRLIVAKAEESLPSDPRGAVGLAELGALIADSLPPSRGVWGLRADCRSTLAFGREAVSDLAGARDELARAEECLALSDQSALSTGRFLIAKSWVSSSLGLMAEAEAASLRARRILEGAGERLRAVAVLNNLGAAYARGGRNLDAVRTLKDALALLSVGNPPPRVLLSLQRNLALLYCELEQPEEARRFFPDVSRLAREVGGDAIIHTRWLEGTLARSSGDSDTALEVFFEIREHFFARGESIHYLESSLDILRVYLALGDWGAGGKLLAETISTSRGMTQDRDILKVLAVLEEEALRRSLSEAQLRALRALLGRQLRSAY